MIYGHQGGWDEILLVLVPIAAIVALLALVKRRAARAADEGTGDDGAAPDEPASPPH